jgi:hypothetical protein
MKKAFFIILFCILGIVAHAKSSKVERYSDWLIDSYNFGKSDNNCSDIYFNYGTPQWTFNSEDPDLLEQLYKACIVGEKDKATGQDNLLQLLNSLDTPE